MGRLGILAVLAVLALDAPAEAKRPRADLTVTAVRAAAPDGGRTVVRVTVRNRGTRRAGRSRTGLFLSSDRKRGDDQRAGTVRVRALKRGRKMTVRRAVGLPAGRWHVLACADARRKLRERSERNNCRASRGRVGAAAPDGPGGGDGGDGGDGGGVLEEFEFPLRGTPRTVSPTLQHDRAVTRRMTPAGATLTATAADGTTYTLTVPLLALPSSVDVRMTPVGAVDGAPLSGGLVGAVEIEPHGITLLKPAELVIDPPGDAPIADRAAFMYHGDGGADFHFYPLDAGPQLRVQLRHFSTPGIGRASLTDIAEAQATPPISTRGQLETVIAGLIRQDIVNGELQVSDVARDGIARAMVAYHRGVIDAMVKDAMTNDAAVEPTVAELISWARMLEQYDIQEHPAVAADHARLKERLLAILSAAVDRAHARCAQHNLDDIARLFRWARVAQQFGSPLGDTALQKVRDCARFELRFTSRITATDAGSTGEGSGTFTLAQGFTVRAAVPVQLDQLLQLQGQAPVAHDTSTYERVSSYACSDPDLGPLVVTETMTGAVSGTLAVLLQMDLQLREVGQPPPPVYDLEVLRMQPWGAIGEVMQTSSTGCGAPDPVQTTETRWRNQFDTMHDDGMTWRQFQPGAGAVIGRKTWAPQSAPLAAETTAELVHTPAL